MFNTVIAVCDQLYALYIVRSSAKCVRDAKLNISQKALSQHPPQNKSFQYSLKSVSEIFLAQTMESVLNYELNNTKSSKTCSLHPEDIVLLQSFFC